MGEVNSMMLNAEGKPFGQLIRENRLLQGLSQEELGRLVHVKKNAVGAWEAGRSRPDLACIPVLCDALGLSLHEFFGIPEPSVMPFPRDRYNRLNSYNRQVVLRQMDSLYHMQQKKPPLREIKPVFFNHITAAAGPISYLEDSEGETVYIALDDMTAKADEIIPVSGDSMEPLYYDGEHVLVQHTERIREGEIGIFVNGNTGYIKEYRKDGLYSKNPSYEPIRFQHHDAVRCIGKVLGTLKKSQMATDEEIAAWSLNKL